MYNMTATYTAPRYTAILPVGLEGDPVHRPSTQVYVRRRLLVAFVLVAIVVALGLGAGNVLANRGGAPASASTVRPATTYVVRSGDTLWSVAAAHHGSRSQLDYVDLLVRANGGTTLQIGQLLALP
jgi:LysM repeat protein